MKVKLFLVLLLTFLLLSQLNRFSNDLFAHDGDGVEDQKINSFDLFWPITAGKTQGDKYYSIKRFKENVRGSLIFNKGKKADYQMFLVTKRVVEAESLIEGKEYDLAIETLTDAQLSASASYINWMEAGVSSDTMKDLVDNMNKQINNLIIFLPSLKNSDNQDVDASVDRLMNKIYELQKEV